MHCVIILFFNFFFSVVVRNCVCLETAKRLYTLTGSLVLKLQHLATLWGLVSLKLNKNHAIDVV